MNAGDVNQFDPRLGMHQNVSGVARDLALFSGTDVVSIARIASMLAEFGSSFTERAFTAHEREYCDEQVTPAQHYAARWAAKESFLKLLDEPSPTVPTAEIEVVRAPTGPRLSLGDRAEAALATRLETAGFATGQATTSVSLSHDRDAEYATAHVLVLAERETETDDDGPETGEATTERGETR